VLLQHLFCQSNSLREMIAPGRVYLKIQQTKIVVTKIKLFLQSRASV
jgi:hypothetical protein